MNESVVKILNVLKKSSDKNVIIKALIKLRTDVVKDKDGIQEFYKADGIPPMVKFLNRPHEKILDIVLSILGNCCTNQNCCAQALENKIILPLVTILKSVPNPSIQNRACRLLGNLARENKTQLLNHSTAIAQSLCLILEESVEIPTNVMATRAAKFLLDAKDFLRTFIKFDGYKILISILCKIMQKSEKTSKLEIENEIENDEDEDVPLVGLKINQHREKYFEEVARNLEGVRSDIFDMEILKKEKMKKNLYEMPDDKSKMDLVTEILKCLLIISEFPSQGTAMGLYCPESGLPCIVYFTDKSNKYKSLALKILSNFSKNPYAVTALSSADAVFAACELLTDIEADLTESEKKYCINIVCMLSSDACNRAKIRRSGALKQLIEIAKTTPSFTEISLILYSLINFQYDSLSMDLMVREGLISILIKELKAFINADQNNDEQRKKRFEEKRRVSRKRKCESQITQSAVKAQKVWDGFEQESPSGSPSYYFPSSPCSSRGLSPVGPYSKNYLDNDDNSDYSPVCSENEADSDNEQATKPTTPAPPEEYDILNKLLDIKNEINFEENLLDNEDDDESRDVSNVKLPIRSADRNTIDIIDSLLLRISLSVCKHGELGKSETLNTIIEAINIFGLNSTSLGTTLNYILSEGKFFASILKLDVTNQLYNMSNIPELKMGAINFIDTLTCVAESNYGIGEILKILKNENNLSAQKRIAIAVSFIIKKPQLLYQLLTENGMLYIVINTILNKDKEFQEEATNAITSLSHTLNITLPISDLTHLSSIAEFDESFDFSSNTTTSDETDEDEVKFLIHRGCSLIPIKFNKKILSENSEVFNSMLNSDFREKSEREIHLHNYSINGIKYFLNLLTLWSKNQSPNIPPTYHFDSILEAYELSKMYIMNDLEKKLYDMLIYRLDETNVLKIFEWSLKNFNQDLSEIAINYYLSSELKPINKVKLYQEADYSKFSKEWNTMLVDAILVKCQNMCNEPNTMVYTIYK